MSDPTEAMGAGTTRVVVSGPTLASIIPERSAEDILAAEVHLRFGPTTYTLPVLSIKANREWKAQLEGQIGGLLSSIDDLSELGPVLAAFATVTDQLLDVLYSYDRSDRLPPRDELEDVATDADVLRAVLEVWSAANPFAQLAAAALRQVPELPPIDGPQTSGSSTPTSGSRPPTGGRRGTSKRN